MHSGHRHLLDLSTKALDLLVMVGAFLLAVGTVAHESDVYSLEHFFQVRLKVSNFLLFALLVVAWHLVLSAFGLYRSGRLSSGGAETIDILKATSVASLAVLGTAALLRIDSVSPRFVVVFWALSSFLTVSTRLTLRVVLQRFRLRGRNLRNLLIVGTNARALRFAGLVEHKPALGYQIEGFVDEEWRGVRELDRAGRRLVAGLSDFDDYLRGHVIDEVVVALPVSSHYAECSRILQACEEQGILVHLLPDFFDVKRAQFRLEVLEDQPVISLRTGGMEGWPLLVKRVLDITVALLLLVLLTPLFVVVAILVKLTSPGPVFFVQQRVGLNKRQFRFLKFRTMVQDAERQQAALESLNEVSGPVFKIQDDPRVTRLGAWLRRTSIDELPQLVNVLLGDMSLVGPRPLPVRDYQAFDSDWHRRRFSVRPGMTCLWQVRGRNSIPFERWMELDMHYIDHWSLWLDLKVLACTLPAVLSGRGAA